MKVIEKKENNKVDFADLNVGDCFKDDDGDIMIKTDWEQEAVHLATGIVYINQCERMITPVNAEVQIID